ncbi:MAG: carboxypeptidase-like regulatory domain-containing protein [Acidobacteria bacterium]|nr:carboxypeptidase-like regulatory domain-containing protein [Acidobacteriota bacterium]
MRSIVLSCLWAALLMAQVDQGRISGKVTDTSGAIIPGVTIQVRNEKPERSAK